MYQQTLSLLYKSNPGVFSTARNFRSILPKGLSSLKSSAPKEGLCLVVKRNYVQLFSLMQQKISPNMFNSVLKFHKGSVLNSNSAQSKEKKRNIRFIFLLTTLAAMLAAASYNTIEDHDIVIVDYPRKKEAKDSE